MRLVAILVVLCVVGLLVWLLGHDVTAPHEDVTAPETSPDASPHLVTAGGDEQDGKTPDPVTPQPNPGDVDPKGRDAASEEKPEDLTTRRAFGRVLDPDGHPLIDIAMQARLSMGSREIRRTKTDAAGRYEFVYEPTGGRRATIIVTCLPDPKRRLWPARQVVYVREGSREVDFVLDRGLRLRGRILDADGKPMPQGGARLAYRVAGRGDRRHGTTLEADEKGEFETTIPRNAIALRLTSKARPNDGAKELLTAHRIFARAADLPDVVTLRHGAGHTLEVVVRREDRKPLRSVVASVRGPHGAPWEHTIGAGSLKLTGLAAGAYVVWCHMGDLWGTRTVVLPSEAVEVVLRVLPRFRVKVKTDATMIGVVDAQGYYTRYQDNPYTRRRAPGYDDWHLIHLPLEGKYAIVDPPDHVDEVEAQLKDGATLSGVVEPRKSAQLRFRRVRIRSVDDPRIQFSVSVNDDGTFAVGAMPPGGYEIDGEDDLGTAFEKLGPFRAGETIVIPWPR